MIDQTELQDAREAFIKAAVDLRGTTKGRMFVLCEVAWLLIYLIESLEEHDEEKSAVTSALEGLSKALGTKKPWLAIWPASWSGPLTPRVD